VSIFRKVHEIKAADNAKLLYNQELMKGRKNKEWSFTVTKNIPEMNDVVWLPIAFTSLATHPWHANANNTSKWSLKERKIQQRWKNTVIFLLLNLPCHIQNTPHLSDTVLLNLQWIYFWLFFFLNLEVCKITLYSVHIESYLVFCFVFILIVMFFPASHLGFLTLVNLLIINIIMYIGHSKSNASNSFPWRIQQLQRAQ